MSRKIGDQAEQQALCFLQKKGFKLIQRNFSIKLGEMDLIGLLDNDLLFVEVKQRASGAFGSALEMVTIKKQQRIRKTAMVFLQQYQKYQHANCRFDVIAITDGKFEWVQDAF